ncbi:MAG: RNA polymerase factor sigma-54 [Pseudomonadota bacterium]
MKQSLQLKLGQSLTMTPQLQQAIRLLQLSTLDLQSEIQEALDSNPMLEVSEEQHGPNNSSQAAESTQKPDSNPEASELPGNNEQAEASVTEAGSDSAQNDTEWSQEIPNELPVDTSWDDVYQSSAPAGPVAPGDDDSSFENQGTSGESLQDHLLWQLNLTPFSDYDYLIAMALIDDVEPSGLLSSPLEDIYEGLRFHIDELEMDEVTAVLHRIQQFDPAGVAGRDLGDCLHIQLNQLSPDTLGLTSAKTIVKEHIGLLGSKDYKSLMRKLRIREDELREAIQLIQSMNPRPGDDVGTDNTEYVVPDVFVNKRNERWVVELNPDIAPKLRINSDYASLVKRADSSSDNTFLKNNLQEARWFLKSLQSRNETLLKVASAIVEKQQGFLDFGEEAMKPLVLHDIAENVEMHESTISRVTTNKYMHTPQGIFELKYFFSSHVNTDSGGECSSTAIRAIIKKLIAAENTQKPLSDSKITALLSEQGIKVARRTIAKYREAMNIPPSNERKQLV